MQRLMIAAASAVLMLAVAAPALAEDYPPCRTPTQDHCRVVEHHNAVRHNHRHAVKHHRKAVHHKKA